MTGAHAAFAAAPVVAPDEVEPWITEMVAVEDGARTQR
jgi:hypothetical protein